MANLFRKLTSSLLPKAQMVKTAPPVSSRANRGPEEFQINLSTEWRETPSSDPTQWLFSSASKRSSAAVSVMPIHVKKERLLDVAEEVANRRRAAEIQARSGRGVEFGDNWVELKDDKELGHVAYAGYDDRTIFRFMAWVTQAKILNLYVETETRDNALAEAVFDEFFSGFRFYVP